MRIYVCWDTRTVHPVLGEHPCGIAYEAVREAGWDPEVVKAYGWVKLPRVLNMTPGRKQVGSAEIVAWAKANPAAAPAG
jgi:hypothetical protein